MRRHLRNPWVWVAAALLFALWLLWPRAVNSPAPVPPVAPVSVPGATPAPASPPPGALPKASTRTEGDSSGSTRSAPAFLPPEALRTIELIERGGPFPNRQDGSVFGNREGRLPPRPRGYYHEYTVATPGLAHRGTRRIVTGGTPPETWYYSDDHYETFRAFAWPPTGGAR